MHLGSIINPRVPHTWIDARRSQDTRGAVGLGRLIVSMVTGSVIEVYTLSFNTSTRATRSMPRWSSALVGATVTPTRTPDHAPPAPQASLHPARAEKAERGSWVSAERARLSRERCGRWTSLERGQGPARSGRTSQDPARSHRARKWRRRERRGTRWQDAAQYGRAGEGDAGWGTQSASGTSGGAALDALWGRHLASGVRAGRFFGGVRRHCNLRLYFYSSTDKI